MKDLNQVSDEVFTSSFGGVARRPCDFTYEVIFLNKRFVKRIGKEQIEPLKLEGWITAPEGYTRHDAIRDMEVVMDNLIMAFDARTEDDLFEEVVISPENKTNPVQMAIFAANHTMYHDAQLNYVQALNGDAEMHWM